MKKIIYLPLIFFIGILFSGFKLHTDVYKVNLEKSSLEWHAEKVGGKHNGTINLSGGEIRDNHGNMNGSFEIDMTSLVNKDLQNPGSKSKLEKHLKSADFFDVEKYPKSTFVISSVKPSEGTSNSTVTHTVRGMLTIKGITNEIVFDASIQPIEGGLLCSGTAVVDRSKFDIRYGSKTFFKDIGDKMINDEFQLKFNITAEKK